MRPIRPQIRPDGVPECSGQCCPAFDPRGRCEITDERSPTYCGPKVQEMAAELALLKAERRAS